MLTWIKAQSFRTCEKLGSRKSSRAESESIFGRWIGTKTKGRNMWDYIKLIVLGLIVLLALPASARRVAP